MYLINFKENIGNILVSLYRSFEVIPTLNKSPSSFIEIVAAVPSAV